MKRYRHTSALCGVELALLVGAGFGLLLALMLLPFVLGSFQQSGLVLPRTLVAMNVITIVMIVIAYAGALMFAACTALTVELDDEKLKFSFRGGFMRRSVPLADIERVETCGPHGWRLGVRYVTSQSRWFELCYAVGARKGVHVRLRNGKQFCIESDEPKTLEFVLREAMKAGKEN